MAEESDLDPVLDSLARGEHVDWEAAEGGADDATRDLIRALHEVDRIAESHRALQRASAPTATPGRAAGAGEPSAPGRPRAEVWGDLAILELASAGANGEVWRAWDTWLQRDVALKFLQSVRGPEPEGAGDSALLDEARALARVRHPGVVAVHGIAEHDGRVGMWMEFLRGKTLAAEIERRGALPAGEVARIGLAICRALESVEAAGVVHQDIKPANIVLESDGRVVLTDFGLGRRWELTDPESSQGSGTPLFMSPGLLAGEPATPRSDLYALGVTLRWALTGRSPFRSRTLAEMKAEAARGPASSLAAECPGAPASLIAAIDRAMAPKAEDRFAGAGQMAAALEAVLGGMEARRSRARTAGLAIAGLLATSAVIVAAWRLLPGLLAPAAPSHPARFTVGAARGTFLVQEASELAISPDGRVLAFVAIDSSETQRVWIRPLSSLKARPLEGTEGADQPFWAPDSRSLGFFAGGKLKKISMSGGAPEVICAARDPRGASWSKQGVIVFAPQPTGPICRVSAEGGEVTEVASPDSSLRETALRWPEFLPDGNHFMCVALPGREGTFDVYVASLDSRRRVRILDSGAAPVCAGPHDLILARGGRLLDQPFDFRTLTPMGEPVSLGPATTADVSVGERLASASMNGVLVQPETDLPNTRLAWTDRSGRARGEIKVPEGRYEGMFFAPDGNRLLAMRRGSTTAVDLWMVDLASGQATRFSQGSQSRIGGQPVWSPDGNRVAFSSNRSGPSNIYVRSTVGPDDEKPLYESGALFKEVKFWSPDGRYLVFEEANPITSWDLWLLPLEGDRKPIPYLRSRFTEIDGAVSPDGRWMAYTSDESGRLEVYVRSFPSPGAEYRVSRDGGLLSSWTRDGKGLIIINTFDHRVWSVPVATSTTFKAGQPQLLFRYPPDVLWITPTPAGDRFLESVPVGDAGAGSVTVQLDWPSLVRSPTAR